MHWPRASLTNCLERIERRATAGAVSLSWGKTPVLTSNLQECHSSSTTLHRQRRDARLNIQNIRLSCDEVARTGVGAYAAITTFVMVAVGGCNETSSLRDSLKQKIAGSSSSIREAPAMPSRLGGVGDDNLPIVGTRYITILRDVAR
jgi:hypothetical protein